MAVHFHLETPEKVIKVDRIDLDRKLNAVLNYAVEHCNGNEDQLDIGISWYKYRPNDPNEKRGVRLFWNFKCQTADNIQSLEHRVHHLETFLTERGFSNIWYKLSDACAILFF